MIKKCNTALSKQNYSPYNLITTSQFVENEEQLHTQVKAEEFINDELCFNIVKLKQCKQQTQQFLQKLNQQMSQQNSVMSSLQQAHGREKEKAKFYRLKYQQMLITNLKKQEELDAMERRHHNLLENYNFVKKELDDNLRMWLEQEQRYKERIRRLEKIVEQQQNTKVDFKASINQSTDLTIQEIWREQKYKSHTQSTFI